MHDQVTTSQADSAPLLDRMTMKHMGTDVMGCAATWLMAMNHIATDAGAQRRIARYLCFADLALHATVCKVLSGARRRHTSVRSRHPEASGSLIR